MSIIKNESTIKEETIDLLRGAIGHRATWMALTYLEAKKAGCDAEAITRAAIRETGRIQGEEILAAMENKEDLTQFKPIFLNEETMKNFEMNVTELVEDNFTIDFSYCPLVTAWQKLDLDDETIDLLCDMAMDGDRAIAEAIGAKFELGDTIAKGCKTCKLHFYK